MRGVTISDLNEQNVLSVDLADLLHLLGERILRSHWRISGVEALGGAAADELQRLSDVQSKIDGQSLIKLAADVDQVVEGEFQGFRDGDARPWIIIRAIDSSAYDVLTDDDRIVEQIRDRFRTVSEIPG